MFHTSFEAHNRNLTQLCLETVCDHLTEDIGEAGLEEEPAMPARPDVLLETAEATDFLENLNSNEATEPTGVEDLEQTGPSPIETLTLKLLTLRSDASLWSNISASL